MTATPQKYEDLAPERRKKLLAHMRSEFGAANETPYDVYLQGCTIKDFRLHLLAAEEGYMHRIPR